MLSILRRHFLQKWTFISNNLRKEKNIVIWLWVAGPIRSGWIWILKHLKYKLHLKHILANVSTCVFSAKLFSHIKWSKEMRLSTSCARRNTRNAVLLKKKWKLQAFQLTSQIDWSCDLDQRLHWNQPVLAASALLGLNRGRVKLWFYLIGVCWAGS